MNLKAYHSCELVVSLGSKPPLGLILVTKLPFLSAARSDFKMLDLAVPFTEPEVSQLSGWVCLKLHGVRSIIFGFYTLVLNQTETEDWKGQTEKKMALFQTWLRRTEKLCCFHMHTVMVVELCSCAERQNYILTLRSCLENKIKPLKSVQNMIDDGSKMLAVKIPYILFTEFITQQSVWP